MEFHSYSSIDKRRKGEIDKTYDFSAEKEESQAFRQRHPLDLNFYVRSLPPDFPLKWSTRQILLRLTLSIIFRECNELNKI